MRQRKALRDREKFVESWENVFGVNEGAIAVWELEIIDLIRFLVWGRRVCMELERVTRGSVSGC